MECQIWSLERYARQTSATAAQIFGPNEWEHFDNSEKLELTITPSDQVLLHHGKRQMESFSLSKAAPLVKGVSKGDSLMIVMKAQDQCRRFRVKFSASAHATAEVNCRACVERLSKHVQIKLPESSVSETGSQQISSTPRSTPGNDNTLVGDVTIGQVADAIISKSAKMPDLYARLGSETPNDLGTMVRLCLSDPSFPAFVEQVEKELEQIQREAELSS